MYIIVVVGSLLFGKTKGEAAPAPAAEAPPASAATHYGSADSLEVPGTFVLAMVFLVSFVLYYFVNWKYLAETWAIG